jgi:LysM repeat protein
MSRFTKFSEGIRFGALPAKTTFRLLNYSRATHPWTKNSRLAIGQQIMLPAGGAPSIPSAPVAPPVSVPTDGSSYVVQAGDSLSRIAGSQGVSLNALFQANGLTKSSIIRPGQVLIIPSGGVSVTVAPPTPSVVPEGSLTHVVKKGDNLTRISAIYGTTVRQIMEWNNLSDAGRISIGQSLVVSGPNTGPPTLQPAAPVPSVPVPADPDASLQNFFKEEVEDRPVINVGEPQP